MQSLTFIYKDIASINISKKFSAYLNKKQAVFINTQIFQCVKVLPVGKKKTFYQRNIFWNYNLIEREKKKKKRNFLQSSTFKNSSLNKFIYQIKVRYY